MAVADSLMPGLLANQMLEMDIAEGGVLLSRNSSRLLEVADYCEHNYEQAEDKKLALETTKEYVVQSLASVTSQIHALAGNFLQFLELQEEQLSGVEADVKFVEGCVKFKEEKNAREEIGKLAVGKTNTIREKIKNPEKAVENLVYVRKPIDFTLLDDIGHGVDWNKRKLAPPVSQGPPAPTSSPSGSLKSFGASTKRKVPRAPSVAPPQLPKHYTATLIPNKDNKPSIQPQDSVTPLEQPNAPITVRPLSPCLESSSDHFILPPPPPEDFENPGFGCLQTSKSISQVLVPKEFLEKVVAVYEYEASTEDELTFQENAVIYVMRKNDDGWWEGMLDGDIGLFPSNYVEPCK